MKRTVHRAVVTDASGNRIIGERDTFAWNSAIRATEAIVREYARDAFRGAFEGARPIIHHDGAERIYRREWTGPTGESLRALVWVVG